MAWPAASRCEGPTEGRRPPQVTGSSQLRRPRCWKGQPLRCSCRWVQAGAAAAAGWAGRQMGDSCIAGIRCSTQQPKTWKVPGSCASSGSCTSSGCRGRSRCRWRGSGRDRRWAGRRGKGRSRGRCLWPLSPPHWPCTPPRCHRRRSLQRGVGGGRGRHWRRWRGAALHRAGRQAGGGRRQRRRQHPPRSQMKQLMVSEMEPLGQVLRTQAHSRLGNVDAATKQ